LTLKDKRVLVTGGAGFIGSHLCRNLVALGAQVYVLVKYNSVIDNVRITSIWNKIIPIEADLRNVDSLRQIQDIKPHIIYHLAAYNHVGDSFSQVSEAIDSNSKGTVNLLESYEHYKRFVYISTSEVYGRQDTVPFIETSKPQPLSPYAVGKYSGELYARLKWLSLNKPIVVLRPFNAYGPYQSPRAITAELIIKCLKGEDIITTEGLQTREFNYVQNLVDGFIAAATVPEAIGQIINLGCGKEISIRDLVQTIHSLTNSSSILKIGELSTRHGEIMRMFCSNELAKNILSWTPTVEHKPGLLRTIEWYKEYLNNYENPSSGLSQLSLSAEATTND